MTHLSEQPGGALFAAFIRDLTILLVEDHAEAREATKLLLEDLGAHVVAAADGREALERLSRVRPHLVLTDLAMPRLGGRELLECLRADPVHRSLPVVVVSGWPSAFEGGRLPVDGYLEKPFDLHTLAAVLCRVIGRHPEVSRLQRRRLCDWAALQRRQSRALRQTGALAVRWAVEIRARGRALLSTAA